MASMKEKLINIFRDELKQPFFYKVDITDLETVEQLFKQIYEIYKIALATLFGDEKTIHIQNLTFDKLEKAKQYMLSLGIEVLYYRLTQTEQTNLYKYLLTELESEDINIIASVDWRTQEITGCKLTFNKNTNINNIVNILNNHKKLCRALNFFGLKEKKELDDFCEKIILDNDIHIVSFRPANIAKYGPTVSKIIKCRYKN